MELHQLRYFVAVVEEGTFTAAAEAAHISQSGISTQVQKLERELGVTLLDRSTRRVALTPEGARLLPYARAALAGVAAVTDAANDLRGLIVGELRIATVTGLTWPRLFDALSAIHGEHPGIDIRLGEGQSDEILDQVRTGVVDLAVAAWAGEGPQDLRTSVVVDDPLIALVAPGHPWAARAQISPGELADADLIALPAGTGSRNAFDAALMRVGRTTAPRWEVATPGYVEALATRGLGVGILSATTAEHWTHLVSLPIADPHARSQLGIAWRPSLGHAAQALLGALLSNQPHPSSLP